MDKRLKIALIILLIILTSIISFVGLYVQEKKMMTNVLANYKLGMDLTGSRVVSIAVSDEKETIYYDKDGKVVEKEVKDGSKKEVPVNSEESLTKENFLKTKEIIEKRLKQFGFPEYLIRCDENDGAIVVQVPEDASADLAAQYVYTVGMITVEGDNNEVLFDSSNIKKATVDYETVTAGTNVYLKLELNKDCVEKLQEASKKYVTTTDSEGKEDIKKLTIYVDGNELADKSFNEEVTDGVLKIQIGSTSTNTTNVNAYLNEAACLAILIDNGKFPIEYMLEQNRYVVSDITSQTLTIIGIVAGIGLIIAAVVLGILYKKNGVLVGIANIGYAAVLLILLRYTNVIITTEGLFGILISVVLNYVFSIYLLKTMKENAEVKKAYNKTVIAMLLVLVPAIIVGITLCFANWMPIYSFGEVVFWGILTVFIYNTVVTRTLLICDKEN